ncbi:MAG: glycosyltransferase family 39 protein [Candidatus Omnitrophica bacterium]|nr:glycosyltransferase family 39 protein [Candidatus Omnitrophota bacterium]
MNSARKLYNTFFLRTHLWLYVFFLVLTVVIYWSSIHNAFLIDDHSLIVKNRLLHNFKYLHYQFYPDFYKQLNIGYQLQPGYYRPFAHLLPGINFILYQYDVRGYHLFNMIVFWLSSLCVYHLTVSLSRQHKIAFTATLLYDLHPINGLMVNYVTANVYAAQMIFLSLSCLYFRTSLRRQNKKVSVIFAFLFFAAALLCHETSLALPVYLFLIAFFLDKKTVKESCFKTAGFFFMMFLYVIFRFKYASLADSVINEIAKFDMNFIQYVATFFKIIYLHIFQLITCVDIVLVYGLPVQKTNVLVWVLSGCGLIAGLLFAFIKFQRSLWLFFILWFFTGFLLVTLA